MSLRPITAALLMALLLLSLPPTTLRAAAADDWTVVFQDDFDGAGLPSTTGWDVTAGTGYPGGPQNGFGTDEIETMTRSTENIRRQDGFLRITPLRDAEGRWTSGRAETTADYKPADGAVMRMECKLAMPDVHGEDAKGYWPACWALGATQRTQRWDWPASGEPDLAESVNGVDRNWSTLHCGYAAQWGGPCAEPVGLSNGGVAPDKRRCVGTTARVRLEWDSSGTEDVMRWYLDSKTGPRGPPVHGPGRRGATLSNHAGYRLILNVAMGGPLSRGSRWWPHTGHPILLPRLAFIGASSLHRGYDSLGQPVRSVANIQDRPLATNGVWAAWPLAFGSAPGAYAGAVVLLAVLFAWRDRARRALVWAMAGCIVLTWLLMLNAIVTAGWFQTLLLKVPFGDVYLHNPGRMRYLSMIAIPVLGGVGLQGLIDRPMTDERARWALGGGVALLLVLPLVAGGKPARFGLLAVAMLAAVPALFWLATDRTRWAMTAVVAVAGIELLASAAFSGLYGGGTVSTGLETGERPNLVPQVMRYPQLSEADFLRPTRFVDIIRAQQDRYLTYAPPAASFDKGYLFTQRPQDWPALAMERGTLFGIPDVLGYNPVQLPRYWTYIRATNSNPVFYNAAVIGLPTLQNVRLLGVRYLVVPAGVEAVPEGRIVASADDYDLVQVYGWEPRVSLVHSWTQVDRPVDALNGVLDPGFDPARTSYVEQDPSIAPTPGTAPGSAVYREITPEDVRVTVDTSTPALVVVRNSYDTGWSATVDGGRRRCSRPTTSCRASRSPPDGTRSGWSIATTT